MGTICPRAPPPFPRTMPKRVITTLSPNSPGLQSLRLPVHPQPGQEIGVRRRLLGEHLISPGTVITHCRGTAKKLPPIPAGQGDHQVPGGADAALHDLLLVGRAPAAEDGGPGQVDNPVVLRRRPHPIPLLGRVAKDQPDPGPLHGKRLLPAAEDGDLMAKLDQFPGEIGAHKAGAAGHKDFHAIFLASRHSLC